MPGAGGALVGNRQLAVVARAMPAAFNGGGVQAGAAIAGRRRIAVAEIVVIAEPAFKPRRVLGYPAEGSISVNDPPGFDEMTRPGVSIDADALHIERVSILAKRDVDRPGDVRQVQVDLHQRGVL
ncbi:MAG: hypothetical protein L3J02_02290, partial [Henriciella sp.]|nr:hypothetical protein [Henriciella sp.]